MTMTPDERTERVIRALNLVCWIPERTLPEVRCILVNAFAATAREAGAATAALGAAVREAREAAIERT